MNNKTSIIIENEYIIVDIETTGFSIDFCNILEIGAVKIQGGDIQDSFHTFIKQDTSIPPFIRQLTGISDDDVSLGVPTDIAIKQFLDFSNKLPLVGHNVSFDYRFLNHYSEKYLGKSIENERIDTVSLAKSLINDIPNFKLGTLVDYFKITDVGQHRAYNDVQMTYELIKCLSYLSENYREAYLEQIKKSTKDGKQFSNKKISIKTKLKYINPRLLECIFEDMNCKVYNAFYSTSDCLIMNDVTYKRFCTQDTFDEIWESWLERAKQLEKTGSVEIYSEKQICEILNIQVVEKISSKHKIYASAKDIVPDTAVFDEMHPLYQKRCVFTGVLDKYDRHTAMQYVANVGGICKDGVTKDTNYLILGDNSYCASIKDGKSSKQKKVEDMILKGLDIQIIPETTFYQLLRNE
ncbi:exonuclease domain-containing protein [Clostridium algidicarnis]|uniref:exonuclease domain-containing protein n=1 Tax=Clostridium algidicarnis TaxID=37659 RepID=UPI001C0E61B2|nr:exonuclease domain-containing protein [Clostridium algidicarnis]MBU3209023.1 hypothetical protein [Clostridium algidicarnis]MBU3228745.1 hypothetical protein [Clostridium algidicarnis]MBU3252289.1 hypothetical protein [Clostridium algidicarnis]